MDAEHTYVEIPAGASESVEWTMNSSSDLQGQYVMLLNDRPLSNAPVLFGTISTCVIDESFYWPGKDTLSELTASNHTGFPFTSSQMIFPDSNVIDGISVFGPSGIVDFSQYEPYIKNVRIETLGNTTPGTSYLTIYAKLLDYISVVRPQSQFTSSSVFGNDTLYGCTPRYSYKAGGQSTIDIQIKVLPGKTIIDIANDLLQKNWALVTTITSLIASTVVLYPKIKRAIKRKKLRR